MSKFKKVSERKGIILAGGNGSRLNPLTKAISKQLLPVYDKPMIYYPLSTLMLAGIREVLIITTKVDQDLFKRLLGNGSHLGLKITYKVQSKPEGIAQAFLISEDFLGNSPVMMILGDNLFHGDSLINQLLKCSNQTRGASVFAYPVKNPQRYGVVEFDKNFEVVGIQEKPIKPKSKYAITGLYFYDNTVVEKAKRLIPSKRGELEITDINQMYLKENLLKVEIMGRGMAWFDTGTFDSLYEASAFIHTLEHRQGLKVGCLEEIAWRQKWISNEHLKDLSRKLIKNDYSEYLLDLISN